MNNMQRTKGDVAFFLLLIIGVITMNSIRYNLASDGVTWGVIKDWISLASKYPDEFGDNLTLAEEAWSQTGIYCQTSALVLGITGFLMGIIVMHWINKLGLREGLTKAFGYIILVIIIVLIVELIFRYLL